MCSNKSFKCYSLEYFYELNAFFKFCHVFVTLNSAFLGLYNFPHFWTKKLFPTTDTCQEISLVFWHRNGIVHISFIVFQKFVKKVA